MTQLVGGITTIALKSQKKDKVLLPVVCSTQMEHIKKMKLKYLKF